MEESRLNPTVGEEPVKPDRAHALISRVITQQVCALKHNQLGEKKKKENLKSTDGQC